MPRKITKEVYLFNELSEEAKKKAIENNRDWNVSIFDWWDGVTDMWVRILADVGFPNAKIWFSGFGSQGDGACFDADVDEGVFTQLMMCETSQTGMEQLRLANLAFHKGFLDLSITQVGHRYVHEGTRAIDWNINTYSDVIDSKLEEVIGEIEDLRRGLCQEIYRDLEREYEYLTSDDVVAESLEVNEVEFEEDGSDARF